MIDNNDAAMLSEILVSLGGYDQPSFTPSAKLEGKRQKGTSSQMGRAEAYNILTEGWGR